jgi:hypothetical protein
MLTAGSVVSTATAFRVALGSFELLVKRTPPLVQTAVNASFRSQDTSKAQAQFRDELIGLARDSTELFWREMRRGVDDFDAATRPRQNVGTHPQRPYRVKL